MGVGELTIEGGVVLIVRHVAFASATIAALTDYNSRASTGTDKPIAALQTNAIRNAWMCAPRMLQKTAAISTGRTTNGINSKVLIVRPIGLAQRPSSQMGPPLRLNHNTASAVSIRHRA